MPENDRQFIPVKTEHLQTNGSTFDFDIFYYQEHRGKKIPLLIAEKSANIDNLKNALSQREYGQLYIKQESVEDFATYIEKTLKNIVQDQSIPLDAKSELLYNCACNVIKDIFDNPRSPENLKRVKQLTGSLVDFATHDVAAIPHLLRLCSHDYYTFTHCIHVACLSTGFYLALGEGSGDELMDFSLGCILHDIGKTQISNAILKKPGQLTTDEFEEIQKHPLYGQDLLAGSVSDVTLDIILNHHERYNGTGYPNGLSGNHISDNAKITIIADVYDALTTNRPYAKAKSPFSALEDMKEKMTGHFEEKKVFEFVKFLGGDIH